MLTMQPPTSPSSRQRQAVVVATPAEGGLWANLWADRQRPESVANASPTAGNYTERDRAESSSAPPAAVKSLQWMSGDTVAQTMAGRLCEPGELFGMCVVEVRNLEQAAFAGIKGVKDALDAHSREVDIRLSDLSRQMQGEQAQRAADVAELRREVSGLRMRPIGRPPIEPQGDMSGERTLLQSMTSMENAIASLRRDIRAEQEEQEFRTQTTQLALSVLRADVSALQVSKMDNWQDALTTSDLSLIKEVPAIIAASEALLKRNLQQEVKAIRTEIENDRSAFHGRLAGLLEHVDQCDPAHENLSEIALLRGRVEAAMDWHEGRRESSTALLQRTDEEHYKCTAQIQAIMDRVLALEGSLAPASAALDGPTKPRAYRALADVTLAEPSLVARLEAVEAFCMDSERLPQNTGASSPAGVSVAKRVKEMEAEFGSRLDALGADLRGRLLREVAAKVSSVEERVTAEISTLIDKLEAAQLGSRLGMLEVEFKRYTEVLATILQEKASKDLEQRQLQRQQRSPGSSVPMFSPPPSQRRLNAPEGTSIDHRGSP